MITCNQILNGTVWTGRNCSTYVVQWITRNVFVLLSAPDRAVHGGTCMVAVSDPSGDLFRSPEGTARFLNDCGAVQVGAVLRIEKTSE